MITVYTDEDYNKIIAQKNNIFRVFMGVTLGYVVFCLAWLAYYISLPYNDSMQVLPKVCVFIASGAYIIFVFPFMGIKYHRIRRYYKMMYYLSEGLKNTEENYFVGFRTETSQKDYVDATGCVFKTWSRKKSEWMERETYFDKEKPLPDFARGDLVKYVVQGNFIVQYEIVKQNALPDDDDDEYEYVDEEEKGEKAESDAQSDTQE